MTKVSGEYDRASGPRLPTTQGTAGAPLDLSNRSFPNANDDEPDPRVGSNHRALNVGAKTLFNLAPYSGYPATQQPIGIAAGEFAKGTVLPMAT